MLGPVPHTVGMDETTTTTPTVSVPVSVIEYALDELVAGAWYLRSEGKYPADDAIATIALLLEHFPTDHPRTEHYRGELRSLDR